MELIKIDANLDAESSRKWNFGKVRLIVKKYHVFMSFWRVVSAKCYLRSPWKQNSTTVYVSDF